MTGEEFWNRLKHSGWLELVPPQEGQRIREALEEQIADNPSLAFVALSPAAFDTETIENDGDYSSVVDDYAAASFGKFAPEEVHDSLDDEQGTATVSFRFLGRTYQRELPYEHDYVDRGLHDMIQQAVIDAGIEERFYWMPAGDTIAYVVFVTPSVYRRAMELGIVPPIEDATTTR